MRVGPIEIVAFLFSAFTLYGCGATAVLYGLMLLIFGIPVYVWQQRRRRTRMSISPATSRSQVDQNRP